MMLNQHFQSSRHPYLPVGVDQIMVHRDQRRRAIKACIICLCFAIVLLFLVLIALQRIHSIGFHKKKRYHQGIGSDGEETLSSCLGYPDEEFVQVHSSASHIFSSSVEILLHLNEYKMSPKPNVGSAFFLLSVNEVIRHVVSATTNRTENVRQTLHHYFISSGILLVDDSPNIELLFLSPSSVDFNNCDELNDQSRIVPEYLSSFPIIPHHDNNVSSYVKVRKLWSSQNLKEMEARLSNITFSSAELKRAVLSYFEAIQEFGTVIFMEPLTPRDEVITNYKFFRNQGYSSVERRVYQGLNTKTGHICVEKVDLIHAYIFGKQGQVLGLLAMTDLNSLQVTLRKCNQKGQQYFSDVIVENYITCARRLFTESPIFLGHCI